MKEVMYVCVHPPRYTYKAKAIKILGTGGWVNKYRWKRIGCPESPHVYRKEYYDWLEISVQAKTSLVSGAGTIRYAYGKQNKISTLPHNVHTQNSIWINDLNVRRKILKFLEENILWLQKREGYLKRCGDTKCLISLAPQQCPDTSALQVS